MRRRSWPAGDRRRRLVAAEAADRRLWQVSVFLEVESAAHSLPSYAGNLDIMTSAALRVGETFAAQSGHRARPRARLPGGSQPRHGPVDGATNVGGAESA